MRNAIPVLAMVFVLAAPAPALADDNQAWETLQIQGGLGGAWKVSNETVLRGGDAKGFYEIENNLMVGRRIDKHVTAWLGYTLDPNYSHGDLTVTEHRIREQVSFDNVAKLGPVTLSGRIRLEERFRDGVAGTGWRLRPYVKASLPLAGKVRLSLAHESFINLNTTAFQKVDGYDRMRNSLMIGVPLNKRFAFDIGYLNQHGFVRNAPDTNDHALMTQLTYSF